MNFTKQDFEKILAYINRRSAKDSSFPVLSEVGDSINVPVLSNGSNRLLPLERLIDYLSKNIDAARIPVDVSGLEGSTLLDVLNELYVIANTDHVIDPETGEGLVLPSEDITYTKSGFNFNDVKNALDTLFDLMSNKADNDDVTSAIGNISNALANKADLETTSRKVLYNQMPSVILRYIAKSATDTEASHTLSEGDVYYGSTGYLSLYTNSAPHSLGTPNKGLIYYCIEDGKYYKYDSKFSWTEIGISGSGDGQGSVSPDLSTILGGDGKIKSALTPACVMYITNAVPSITDVPVHSYYCLLSTRPQDVNIYYRDEVVTEYITQFNDILIGQPQANVIYYDIVTDKLYRWQSSKFVNLTHNASLGDDGRVVPEQATSVVLKYIASVNNTNIPQLNTGDVYCDQSNILWVKGSSYGPDIAPISHTSENGIIEVGSPDSHLIYYNIHTNGFYKWSGSSWDMIGSSGDGTITSIMMNGSVVREYEGTVDLGTVVTDISGKTDKASDSRLQSSQATAVILKYINGKITDDEGNESTEGFIDNPPLVGDGDVFFSGNHISARVAGNSVNLGLPDSSIIYYNLYTKKFYRWKGTDYGWGEVGVTVDSSDFALKNDLMITTNGDKTTITLGQGKTVQVINQHQSLSSYATKNEMSVSESNGVATIQVKHDNSATVYTKSKSDALLGGKQDTLQFDNEPTQNSQKMVKSGGIYTALQNLLSNISIGTNGNWFIGETDTQVKARGVDGITVSDPEDIQAVHDLNGEPDDNFDPETQVAVLGADVGPMIQELIEDAGGIDASVYTAIKENVNAVAAKVNAMLAVTGLANIAFVGTRPSAIPELVWPDGGDSPVLNSPQNGDEVNVGTIPNNGTSVTKTVTIKGKNLESAVNLAISGTGFSLSANSVSAADANAGTTVTITYTDSGTGDGLDKTGTLTVTSAGSEFTQRTVTLKGKKLAPGVVEPVVSLAANDYLELTGSLSGETYSGVLSIKSAYSTTKGLPWPEDISAVMGGTSKVITYNDSTGAITINGVTADVTVTAVASVVDGVDYQNNPIRWKEGLYFNGNGSYNNKGDNTSTDANWCISDFVKCDWNDDSLGNLTVGTGVSGIVEHYIVFYDTNKQYVGRLSLNERYRTYDMSVIEGIAYFRTSMLISKRSTRIIRDIDNGRFLLRGSDYDGRYDGLVWASSWCIHGATGSIPEGTYIDDANSTTTNGKPTYCRNAAYISLQTASNSFEYSSGFKNASNANDYDRRCMELRNVDNSYGGRLFPHSGTSNGTTAYGLDYFEFTNASASYNGIRGSFSINNLDDCYIYDKVNSVYLFRGMNNPVAVNDNGNS